MQDGLTLTWDVFKYTYEAEENLCHNSLTLTWDVFKWASYKNIFEQIEV